MTKLKVVYLFLFILSACNGSDSKPNQAPEQTALFGLPQEEQNIETIHNKQTIESADALSYIETIDIGESTHDLLGQIASFTLEKNLACDF